MRDLNQQWLGHWKRQKVNKIIDKSQPPISYIPVEKINREQKVFIDYGRMKGRPKFTTLETRGNPHFKRFDNLDHFPNSSTKAR